MAGSDGQVVFTVELDDTAFQAGITRLQGSLAGLCQSVLAAFRLSPAQLLAANAAGTQWAAGFAAGIRQSIAATLAAQNAVNTATSAARSVGLAGGTGVGQSIVAGMAAGANGQSGLLSAALTRIIHTALAAARRAAGIASPSRLFRDEVGRYLALGVQDGFTDTMAQSALPAMGRSLAQTAAAGRQALNGTLLASIGQAATASVSAPILSGAVALNAYPAQGSYGTAKPGDTVYHITQNITFSSPMQAPDEVARAMRRQAAYGLAAARGKEART